MTIALGENQKRGPTQITGSTLRLASAIPLKLLNINSKQIFGENHGGHGI